jgi:hypothetical protein
MKVPSAATTLACMGALPNLVVIGAMKSGTTALHHYLGYHPDIAMSRHKELNFFYGPMDTPCPDSSMRKQHPRSCTCWQRWVAGNWHRGTDWYASHFRLRSMIRGESSPTYTSPSYPLVPARMAQLIPTARLVYLVRDPVASAISQYGHHRRDGTERRPIHEALLDANSQYISRGRYYERLGPFRSRFAKSQIAIIAQEDLLTERRATMRTIFRFLEVDESFWNPALNER